MQNVPISITAVSGQSLQDAGISHLGSLSASVPNFMFSESVALNDQVSIRGVGSGVNAGFENSVGLVIDGFFFGRSRFDRAAFLDLAQVEVLRGPQGALIGKNTTAGAINIRTAMPTDTLQGYLSATGEFEGNPGETFEGAISGPITDRLKARLAFRYNNKDGYFYNATLHRSEMQQNDYTVRGTATYDITSALSATLMFQHGKEHRIGRNRTLTNCSDTVEAALQTYGASCQVKGLVNYSNNEQYGKSIPDKTDTKFNLVGLTMKWHLGSVGTLTSLTGYADYDVQDSWDGDLTPIEATSFATPEHYQQWSQEVRLASNGNKTLDYIVGAYFMGAHQNSALLIDFNLHGPAPLFPNLPAAFRARDNTFNGMRDSVDAVFGQLSWHITPQWDLTGGLRYTHEVKVGHSVEYPTALYTETPIPVPAGGPATYVHNIPGRISEDQLTPDLTLQWFANDNTMFYAKAAQGFKGGGFNESLAGNQNTPRSFTFKAEKVTAYEVGGKLTLLDDSMQANFDYFHSKFTNMQVSAVTPDPVNVIFDVGNAASAISQGVEAGLRWRPIDGMLVNANAAYLDATFGSYKQAPCFAGQTVAEGCVGKLQDSSGNVLPFAPKWKFSVDAEYTWLLPGSLTLTAYGQVVHSSSYALTYALDPHGWQSAYTKLNARLSLGDEDGKWQASLIGRNLTDVLTSDFGNTTSLASGFFRFFEPPRELEIQLRYNL